VGEWYDSPKTTNQAWTNGCNDTQKGEEPRLGAGPNHPGTGVITLCIAPPPQGSPRRQQYYVQGSGRHLVTPVNAKQTAMAVALLAPAQPCHPRAAATYAHS
jgi:hypothetical protein